MEYGCSKLWMQTDLDQKVGKLGLTSFTDEDGAVFLFTRTSSEVSPSIYLHIAQGWGNRAHNHSPLFD